MPTELGAIFFQRLAITRTTMMNATAIITIIAGRNNDWSLSPRAASRTSVFILRFLFVWSLCPVKPLSRRLGGSLRSLRRAPFAPWQSEPQPLTSPSLWHIVLEHDAQP